MISLILRTQEKQGKPRQVYLYCRGENALHKIKARLLSTMSSAMKNVGPYGSCLNCGEKQQ